MSKASGRAIVRVSSEPEAIVMFVASSSEVMNVGATSGIGDSVAEIEATSTFEAVLQAPPLYA